MKPVSVIFSIIIILTLSCKKDKKTVFPLPTVSITAPLDGLIIEKSFDVEVEASVENGIKRVELYLNNILIGTAETAPYKFTVNVDGYGSGSYVFKAIAYSNSDKQAFKEKSVTIAKPSLEKPLDLKASKGAFGAKIKLDWVSSPGATSYQVYKLDLIKNEYVLKATVTTNSYEDLTIEKSLTQYFYKVKVFNSATQFSILSETAYGYTNGNPYDVIRSFGTEGVALNQFGLIVHFSYYNNTIYVADDYHNRTVKYTKEGDLIGLFQSYNSAPIAPVFFGNKILNIYGNTILVQTGTTTNKTIATGLTGLRQATLDNDNFIYVTASNSNKIGKYDLQGNLILQWGVKGNAPGEVDAPWGIAYFNDKIVFSNYFSKKVQFFTKSGTFIKEWNYPDLNYCYDLYVKDNYLYIVCGKYIIKTDYDGVVQEKIYSNFGGEISSMAMDEDNNIYVTNFYGRKIIVIKKN